MSEVTDNTKVNAALLERTEAQAERIALLEATLKNAAAFIHRLGPTIDYPISDEIREVLGE